MQRIKVKLKRWFRTFQTKYLNGVVGSFGCGILSKQKDSRVSQEMQKIYNGKIWIRNEDKTIKLIHKLINDYNIDVKNDSTDFNQNKFNLRKFNSTDIPKLFYEVDYRKVSRSMLIIIKNKKKYIYTIKNREIRERVNNTIVKVRYDLMDMSEIYIYDEKYDLFITSIPQEEQIHIVATENDLKRIREHNKMITDDIHHSITKLINEHEKGKIELKSIPNELLGSEKSIKKILSQAENDLMVAEIISNGSKYINSSNKKKNSRTKERKNVSDIYFQKNRKMNIIIEDG